jgi:hypothetical protein
MARVTHDRIKSISEKFVKTAKEYFNVQLTYDIEGLKQADKLLVDYFSRLRGKQDENLIASTILDFGCYFGETVIKNSKYAKWKFANHTLDSIIVVESSDKEKRLELKPFAIIAARLNKGVEPLDSILVTFNKTIEKRLK